jgi:hypothetical protein
MTSKQTVVVASALMIFGAFAVLGGCDLFGKLEKELTIDQEAKDACKAYCTSMVNGAEACLWEWAFCNIEDIDSEIDKCTDDCIDVGDDIDEDKTWEAIECMWCINDEIGDDPNCDQMLAVVDTEAICKDECEEVEELVAEIGWMVGFFQNPEQYCDWYDL